jgi:hypothetical protein
MVDKVDTVDKVDPVDVVDTFVHAVHLMENSLQFIPDLLDPGLFFRFAALW